MDVFLALGIFSERIALHGGFELDAFQQGEGIDVAEHWADDGNPVGQAGDGPEAQTLDDICAHVIIQVAFEGAVPIDDAC